MDALRIEENRSIVHRMENKKRSNGVGFGDTPVVLWPMESLSFAQDSCRERLLFAKVGRMREIEIVSQSTGAVWTGSFPVTRAGNASYRSSAAVPRSGLLDVLNKLKAV